jgi:Na+/H+ antiporter NhaC
MLNSWLTVLPPLLVIAAAIITQQIHISLFIGVLVAAFVAANGYLLPTLTIGGSALWNTATNIDNLYLYGFLIFTGILVSLFSANNSAESFAQAVAVKIRSARQAQYSSLFVSCLLFIDDYLSILTTGYVMSPIMDHFHLSRNKLAFLVHSFGGPIVILAPVSSWVATIIAYIDHSGVDTNNASGAIRILADPFFVYLQSIPFIFYSLLVIASVLIIIRYSLSYGPMRTHEAQISVPIQHSSSEHKTMRDLLIPLSVLVGSIMIGLPWAGGFYIFGGQYGLIESIKYNKHPFFVMLTAALLAVTVSMIRSLRKKQIRTTQIPQIVWNGVDLMYSAIGMVFLASTLSDLLANHVGTGQYLAFLLIGSVPLFLLPVMFFIVSLICTIATGSAWGNFALMIPIAIPMLTTLSGLPLPIDPQALPLLFPVLGAIFSGSVCGDHISPLSETTIMAATSTGTKPIEHAYTQFPYAVPAIVGSIVAFIVAGIVASSAALINITLSLGIGLVVCIGLLYFFSKRA